MLKIDSLRCTGCGACVQRCPKQCIHWVEGALGHRIPEIDGDRCIGCGLCDSVCPIGAEPVKPRQQKAWGAVHRDLGVRMDSTSGGFFTALAEHVLAGGGLVYGCAFGENFRAEHIRVDRPQELHRLRGSKYLQSDTGTAFQAAEKDLKDGKTVLFTGTPCQIAGLKAFLGRPYEGLITADLVCHGVGSQAYFDRYLEFVAEKYGPVRRLHFRDKAFAGWSCGGMISCSSKSEGGADCSRHYYDFNHYYYYYFLHGDIYRDSCYTCPYASLNRPGDFTMGDFWGVEKLGLELQTREGCSLVLTNTPRGQALLEDLGDVLRLEEVTLEQACRGNVQLSHPPALSGERPRLIREYETLSGRDMDSAFRRNHRKAIVKHWIKTRIPYSLRVRIRRIMK